LADHQATSHLAGAALFPASHAPQLGTPGPENVYVRVRPGRTQQVAVRLPHVLHPSSPRSISAFASAPVREVTDLVETETQNLFVLLSVVAIVLSTLTVGVVMLMTVLERRTEIGLRRAIGATRLRVACEFLVHSAWLGLLGGTAGTALGTLVTAAVALLTHAPPVTDPRVILAGPLIGTTAGLLAGVYPAIRAAHIPPAPTRCCPPPPRPPRPRPPLSPRPSPHRHHRRTLARRISRQPSSPHSTRSGPPQHLTSGYFGGLVFTLPIIWFSPPPRWNHKV